MFKKAPSLYKLENLLLDRHNISVRINEKWVPARACGLASITNRLRLAWMVFTGKGDVVIWPEGQ